MNRLIVLCRIQQRRLPGRHALGFCHPVRDELVFVAVGVAGTAVLADCQGIDERGSRGALDGLEQGCQEGSELVSCVGKVVHLAKVDRQLIQQDECRFAAKKLAKGVGSRCRDQFITLANALEAGLAGERIGDFTPRRLGVDILTHVAAVGRVGIFSIESSNPNLAFRHKRGIDEFVNVCNAFHAPSGVGQRDQAVCLTAAVGRVEAEDRGNFTAGTGEAPTNIRQKATQSTGRVCIREKLGRNPVLLWRLLAVANNERQIGSEISFADSSLENIISGDAEFENRMHKRSYPFKITSIIGHGRRTMRAHLLNHRATVELCSQLLPSIGAKKLH